MARLLAIAGHRLEQVVTGLQLGNAISAEFIHQRCRDLKGDDVLDDNGCSGNRADVTSLVIGAVGLFVFHPDRIEGFAQGTDRFFSGPQDEGLAVGHAPFESTCVVAGPDVT